MRSIVVISSLTSYTRDAGILSTLHGFATNKKSGYERESAGLAFQSLSKALGPSGAPLLLPSLPILFDLYNDKGDVVREAASIAAKSILKLFPPESTRIVFQTLEDILDKGKWQAKVGALEAMKSFVNSARDAVAGELGSILPKVEGAMHDTKKEVRSLHSTHDDHPSSVWLDRSHLPRSSAPRPSAQRWQTPIWALTSRRW